MQLDTNGLRFYRFVIDWFCYCASQTQNTTDQQIPSIIDKTTAKQLADLEI